jgi:cobalt/nickel transport system permease protein
MAALAAVAMIWIVLAQAGLFRSLLKAAAILPFPLSFGLVSWWVSGDPAIAAALVVRSYLSALVVVLLMNTTTLADIFRGLQSLGVPAVLVLVLQSLTRYLQVLIEQGLRMRRAALSRGGNTRQRYSLWQRAGGALAVLFGKSYGRAENVHQAMLARGFQGTFIALRPHALEWRDFALTAVAIAMSVGAAWR